MDNWAEVMADPSVLADDVRGYLEAENAYAATVLAPTEGLQEALFSEFRGRIKEDDQSPAVKDGPYAYYVRFRTGGQYAVHCRKDRDDTGEGSERIIFDGDKEAEATTTSAWPAQRSATITGSWPGAWIPRARSSTACRYVI